MRNKQESMMPDKDTRNIYQRLVAAWSELQYIQNDRKAPSEAGGYAFVSHDIVTRHVRGALMKHGIALTVDIPPEHIQWFDFTDNRGARVNGVYLTATVTLTNIDKPTEQIVGQFPGSGFDKQDKAVGKAVSYAVKYALLKLMMLETGDDPENDAIERNAAESAPAPAALTWESAHDTYKRSIAAKLKAVGIPAAHYAARLEARDVKQFNDLPKDDAIAEHRYIELIVGMIERAARKYEATDTVDVLNHLYAQLPDPVLLLQQPSKWVNEQCAAFTTTAIANA